MQQGTIVNLNPMKGYGFISPDGLGENLFFHHTSMVGDWPFSDCEIDDRVEFDVGPNERKPGHMKAIDVRLLD